MKSVCWGALVVLVLSGCASTKTETTGAKAATSAPATSTAKTPATPTAMVTAPPAASATAKLNVVTDEVNGFSVELPDGYTQIKDMAQLKSLIKAGAASDPRLKLAANQYAALGDKARVFAFRLGRSSFADNVNILAGSADGVDADHIGSIYSQVKTSLSGQLGATITDHRIETVAGTKALRIEYRMTLAKQSVRGIQIYLVHNGKALVTTITQNDVASSMTAANRIIDSLRFV